MAKGGNSLNSKRSRNAKPYDANNSFVKKVATKVTDLIPQRSWISKWFNSSQDNGEMTNDVQNSEDSDNEQEQPQPPPTKRPRIRMDVTHPPGTFDIQPRSRTSTNEVDPQIKQYPIHNETTTDFLEPPVAGTSGVRRLVASTPAVQPEIRSLNNQNSRGEFISLTSTQNNGAANGTDDNSESSESTSGCSSLIPQVNRQEAPSSFGYNRSCTTRKRYIDDKLNFTNHLQSPRSLFLDDNPRDSLSSRRPSFNASIMNNSLERGPSLSSPFYNGNTTFGGANTAGFQRRGRTLFNSTNEFQLKVPNRTNVQVKSPSTTGTDSSGMSQTAKRILEALEHFSSPILDAKKIPMNANNGSSPISARKRQREDSGTPSARVGLRHLTRELTVPTVPDLLKLRRRQRLQDTTVAARKIVSARSGPPPTSQEYKLRSSDDEKTKYMSKVKAKDKNDFEEYLTADVVNLPNVALPINTLPTFDIMVPVNADKKTPGSKEESFKFASPIKTTDTNKNLKSINNFTFSKPISADDKDSSNDSQMLSKTVTIESDSSFATGLSGPNFMWSKTSTAPRMKGTREDKESSVGEVKVGSNFDIGGVMDILQKKFDGRIDARKPAVGMWECSQCLIRNPKEKIQCAACKASKTISEVDQTTKSSSTSSNAAISQSKPVTTDCFGSQFKMSSNQWECGACLVRNKQTDVKCVSCTTPKPGSAKPLPLAPVSSVSAPVKSDLMEKFKPPEGSWECSECMVRNSGSVETCSCCSASKPGLLKISPKKAVSNSSESDSAKTNSTKTLESSWECLNCKSKNPSSCLTCPCSSVPNLNSKVATETGFGEKFKKPAGAWTCEDCMLQNKPDLTECIACCAAKPGLKKIAKPTSVSSSSSGTTRFSFGIPQNSGGFKFGIDDKEKEKSVGSKSESATGGFTFGVKSDPPKTDGFTFGIPQNPTGFTFGIPQTEKIKQEEKTKPAEEKTGAQNGAKKRPLNTEEPTKQPAISFGIPITEETKPPAEKQFTFGAQPGSVNTGPTFTFGGMKTDSAAVKTSEIPKVNFSAPITESSKLSFASSANVEPAATLTSDQSNLLRTKSSTTTETKSANNPIFGTLNGDAVTSTITSSSTSAPVPGVFTFGAATTIQSQLNSLPAQSFAQNSLAAAPSQSTSTTSMFVFGSMKPTNATTTTPPDKPQAGSVPVANSQTFTTANPTQSFDNNDNKPAPPAFGVSDNKAPLFFGNTDTATSVFGAPDNKIMAFGSTDKTPFNSTTPAFGTSSASSAFGSMTPAFGTAPTSAFGINPTPSRFPATKPTEMAQPPSSGLFTFGGGAAQATSQPSSGFSFSTSNSTPASAQAPAQKSMFSFGNSTNTQQPPASGGFGGSSSFNLTTVPNATQASFTFNAPKPDAQPPAFAQTAPISTSMFGAPQNPPSFGQNQATPAFGSVAPAPSTSYNFGSSVPAASSGFSFGGQASAPNPSSGGFAFNAPNPSPAIAFDPNTPPAFKFTGGTAPTAFNAKPQVATVAPATTQQRKIKKAVRRSQQPR